MQLVQFVPNVSHVWHGDVQVLHVLFEFSGYVPAGQLLAWTQVVPVKYTPDIQLLHAVLLVHVTHGLTQARHREAL
jgi:hypothetical protein